MNLTLLAVYCLCIAVGYFAGSIPCGYIIGRCHGKDIRNFGSGNIGATNVLRVIGPWWGRLCFLLDFLKGLLPVLAVQILISAGVIVDKSGILPLAVLAGVVAGHMFTCFLKFKGGKGIATAAGGIFAVAPVPLLAALVVWIVVFKISRYVSLGSIIAAAALPFFALLNNWLAGKCDCPVINRLSSAAIIFLCAVALLAILKHKSNIKRLIAGTENRFERKNGKVGKENK